MKISDIIFIPLLLLLLFFTYFLPSFYLPAFLLSAGCFVLIKGSDFFVESAVSISSRLGVSEHTIGLTVVAFGTSLPEFAISSIASYQHYTDTAWGNVIGSNVTNILLILGIAMIIITIKPSKFAIKDSLSMVAISFIVLLLALDDALQFYDGILLISLYILFVYLLKGRGMEGERKKGSASLPVAIVMLILGIAGIAIGADAVVKGAVNIAELFGVKEISIAASIVAFGTSLPELSTTVTAAIKKHHGIAVGNVIGSNVMNLGIVLGFATVLHKIPISLASPTILFFVMVTLIMPFILKMKWVGKKTGVAFLCLYAIFLFLLY
ncbi:MAG: calcium/sodium antiporter [Thermoplasmata archaeon]|nr:MAG: calcium/sodium antiporter [Thermoplasmata archaeon]